MADFALLKVDESRLLMAESTSAMVEKHFRMLTGSWLMIVFEVTSGSAEIEISSAPATDRPFATLRSWGFAAPGRKSILIGNFQQIVKIAVTPSGSADFTVAVASRSHASRDLRIVDQMDDGILICSDTAIPKSSDPPLEVVATLEDDCVAIDVKDGVQTEFVGVYSGAVDEETLECVICGPGQNPHPVYIPRGERISLRNMKDEDIVNGELILQFVGYRE